jgi:hypothetical protein
MPNTPDMVSCLAPPNGKSALLGANPFLGLFYHFGQLLGVDDFETEQAYHRGKVRLHNAWLHREGVVWGLGVEADAEHGELRVKSGLALDGAGHELFLEADACLKLADWYDANKAAADAARDQNDLTAHVLLRFKACLSRPVPAMSEPCVGAQTDTAYSRAVETVELLLRPGPAPARTYPYHLLRLLFALDDPVGDEQGPVSKDEQDVLDARKAILLLPTEQQPKAYLKAFRRFAAQDEIGLGPLTVDGARLLFPAADDTGVVLAKVTIALQQRADGSFTPSSALVDNTVRPSHVATSTIQELLCGPLFAAVAAQSGVPPVDPVSPGAGPRVDPSTFALDRENLTVTFTTTAPLAVESVRIGAFSLAVFDNSTGWTAIDFDGVGTSTGGSGTTVTLQLHTGVPDTADLIRFVAVGTGAEPILGTNLVPLAGASDDPPGIARVGQDFVYSTAIEPNPS